MTETPRLDPINRAHIGRFCQLAGAAALVTSVALAVWASHELPRGPDWPRPQRITCVNNLKQIGLAFRTWAIDHDGRYPFNCSTNDGGTLELCARGPGGFDTNAALHFQVMSNELTYPLILICPKDRSRKPARDFQHLRAANVTYQMRTGTNLTEGHPQEVLVRCPIHGNILRCDESVTEVTADREWQRPDVVVFMDLNPRFRLQVWSALATAVAGCGLLWVGSRVRYTKG